MKQFIFIALALSTVCLSHAQPTITKDDNSNCDKICKMNYEPICAVNENGEKNTFGNKCALESVICQERAAYTIVNEGECVSESENSTCDKVCEMHYEPICATNENGEKNTFGNKCALESVICQERAAYTIVNEGECDVDASSVCTMQYSPICATNPITAARENFPNGCELGVASCLGNLTYTDVTEGECDTLEPNCPNSCPMNYDPVCGTHSETSEKKTFSNACVLGVESCLGNLTYTDVIEGECDTLEPNCSNSCTMNFDPVCGTHPETGEKKTFANACALGVESCLANFNYTDVTKGECKIVENKCQTMCTMQLDPVCGTHPETGEKKTFANACALGVESCLADFEYTDVLKGECKIVENKCQTMCTMQLDPVCATNPITGDRKTYANGCALGVESCEADIVYTDVTKGDCNNNEISSEI